MKKLFLLPLLGLLAVGCANSDSVLDNKDAGSEMDGGQSGYLSVSIVTPRGTVTRADGKYQSGTESESAVKKVRFFFFDNNGEPVLMKKKADGTYSSYYDWEPNDKDKAPESSDGVGTTVEKIVYTTVVLNGPSDTPDPTRVIAIVNPTEELLADKNLTMSEVRASVADYQSGLTDKNFVMSNSVYVDNNTIMDYADLTGKIFRTYEEAEAERLQIYVERVVARVDLSIGKSSKADAKDFKPVSGTDVYDTGMEIAVTGTTKQKIYVKLLGWAVTSTPNKSRLLKNIAPMWSSNLFGYEGDIEPWNSSQYHRSFWAVNPSTPYNYQFFTYNTIANAQNDGVYGIPEAGSDKSVTAYVQENAAYDKDAGATSLQDPKAKDSYDKPTELEATDNKKEYVRNGYESKVIVAGVLQDKSGNELTIAEYGYKYYTDVALLDNFAGRLEFTTSANGGDKITGNDLTFMTQAQYNSYIGNTPVAGVGVEGGYYVYVVLKNRENATWYIGDVSYNDTKVAEYIQNTLDNRVLLWDEGRTYYYFPIRHLGNMIPADDTQTADAAGDTTPAGDEAVAEDVYYPGYYGVVRNHIYDAKIVALKGLGTPVHDPDETIYPEQPKTDGSIIAAEINILQWRVVPQEYEFSW